MTPINTDWAQVLTGLSTTKNELRPDIFVLPWRRERLRGSFSRSKSNK